MNEEPNAFKDQPPALRSPIRKGLSMMAVMVFFPFLLLHAQQIRITATLDSTNYLIGDWIRIQISAAHSNNTKMLWNYPLMINSEHFEKLSESAIDSIQQKDFLTENRIITVTTFDTGVLSIPPLTCYFEQGGITDSVITAPLAVYISAVSIDTAIARAIKPPYEIPATGRKMWWYIIPLLSILFIALVGWYLLVEKRKKTKSVVPGIEDLRLPHEKAFDNIRELEEGKLWERNRVKDYYVKITQILREYIETGLDLPAFENTTYEIILSLKKKSLDENLLQQLNHDLSMADLVKFAKKQPTITDHLHILKTVKDFVEKTRPANQQPAQEGSPA